jgi:hypothetical protein
MRTAPNKSADDLIAFLNLLFDRPTNVWERGPEPTQDILQTFEFRSLTGKGSLFDDVFVKILSCRLDIAVVEGSPINARTKLLLLFIWREMHSHTAYCMPGQSALWPNLPKVASAANLRAPVLSDDFVKHLSGLGYFQGTVLPLFGKCDQGSPQCPSSRTAPSVWIQRKSCAKGFATFSGKKCPCDHQVTGRIPDTRGAEIDDSTQTAARNQQVSCTDISMQPDRWATPFGFQGFVPD